MPRRIDAGPALAALGAALLLFSLFLAWFDGRDGWRVFEALDLVLAGLALTALNRLRALARDPGLRRQHSAAPPLERGATAHLPERAA